MTNKPVIMDKEEIKTIIPHRDPLLLIENVHELETEKRILASYQLKSKEPVFAGHFPDQPIYPGVYYIESIAQAGAVLIFETRKQRGILVKPIGFLSAVQSAKFRKIAGPGDLLLFEVKLEKERGVFYWITGKVFVGESLIAEVSLSIALGEK